MTTVSLPVSTITRAQYDALQGQPMHRTYSLLSQSCPGCGGLLKPTGFADWVKGHGIVVSLWDCVAAPTTCEVSRLATTFRLETQVIEPHLDINQCQCETVSQHWAIVAQEADQLIRIHREGSSQASRCQGCASHGAIVAHFDSCPDRKS